MNSYSTDNTDIDDAGLLEYAASLGYDTSPATQSPMSDSINLGPQDVSGDSNEVHSDEHSAVRISVMNDYINNTMQKEIAEFARNGNLKSGYATSKKDLQRWKDLINEMCRERGLSVAEKGRHFDGTEIEQGSAIAWTKNKYQLLNRDGEKKTASGKQSKRQPSYLLNCATAVLDSLEKSADKDEFIHEMGERGWSVNWKDSRKNITFENEQGNKVRDSNLTKTFNQDFSKEELLHELERQKEIRAKQAARREAEQERIATEERELDEYYRQVESAVEELDTEAVDGNRSTEEADSRSDGEDTKAVIRDARDAVRNNRSDNRAVRHAETESEIAEEQSVASAEQRRLAEQQRAEDESRNRRNNFSHGDYYSR